jgi:Holliday junction DNA helicase RuvA
MFDFIRGKLAKIGTDSITLETCGVGYKIFTPPALLKTGPKIGSEAIFYTSFVVRECFQAIYGFPEEGQRDFFEILININGIGPKTALSLLGHISFEELFGALSTKDTRSLCRVPGIGKKTAERLLLDLKDTLPLVMSLCPRSKKINPISLDATSALINLGYNQCTAQRAVQKVLDGEKAPKELSEVITHALKVMSD